MSTTEPGRLRVHRILDYTRAEGPGPRAALWVQGCSIRCPGCFNPTTWNPRAGEETTVEEVARRLLARAHDIQGITLLGGEPFDQAAPLAELAKVARGRGLSVMTFTGHRLEDLRDARFPPWEALLAATDLLVDGPYDATQPDHTRPWVGSVNQRFHALSNRYADIQDILDVTPDRLEVRLSRDGRVEFNGMATADQLDSLLAELRLRRSRV